MELELELELIRASQHREREDFVVIILTFPRTECALVSLSKRKQFPHRAWFLARACLRVQEEGYQVPDKINSQQSRCFGDLMDREWLRSGSVLNGTNDPTFLQITRM